MKPKIALCMIVKADDKESELMFRSLTYSAKWVDKVFITITGKNEKVEKAAKLFNAEVSYFDWVDDFSKARNFNFSQVPKEYDYILWCDADDAFRGLENLKSAIEKHPADTYSMFYLYAFDEYKNPIVVHTKTRVIKNDGCCEWAGALHEDFKENRQVSRYHIKDIEVLHLSNDKRFEEAKDRNLKVARGQLKELPNDPRSYWNMGNSFAALNKSKEALEMFDKFLELSESDDEKYIVRLRRAESWWKLDDKLKAIDEARYAIGLKPEFPDAYNLLGTLYFESGRFKEARDTYLMGLVKKPPYYEIVVYNPRDYDYTPLMNLAKTYFNLSMPTLALECLNGCLKIYSKNEGLKKTIKVMEKEAEKFTKVIKLATDLKKIEDKKELKKKLEEVPSEFQSHPAICNIRNINFIKENTTGKDLVFFCGFTTNIWTPETAKEKGVGGSEEAVIHLANGLAEKGLNVTVYNNCGHKELKFGKVTYKPFWTWNHRDKQDITILWRTPRYLDYDINSEKIFVDLHDTIGTGEFNEKRMSKVDKIFVKSKFHRSLYPHISDDKFIIVSNGIDVKEFSGEVEKDPYLILNTSSADRGLSVLVDLFKEVKKQVPQAKCKWAYGWNIFDDVHGENDRIMKWKKKVQDNIKNTEGFEVLGMVSHKEVAELYKKASVLGYPTEFAEIDCISLSKAMASGAYPITSDFSALGERKGKGGHYIHSEKTKDDWAESGQFDWSIVDEKMKKEWVDKVVDVLKNPPNTKEMREYALETYSWDKIIDKWYNIIYNG